MKTTFYPSCLALLMLLPMTSIALAQDDPTGVMDHSLIAEEPTGVTMPAPSEYWLGIECWPASSALRAQLHLPDNQGIVAQSIVPDSPAAKAGLAKFDIILKANDKALSDVPELIQAVDSAKGKEIKLEIIREGKPMTITATPAKRPEGAMAKEAYETHIRNMHKMLEEMAKQAHSGQGGPMQFFSVRPGVILPPGSPVQPPLPADTTISISKTGDKPADIVVKIGNDKWETTEKDLNKLPEKVRPYVERMLGSTTVSASDASHWMPEVIPQQSIDKAQQSLNKAEKKLEKRMDEMRQRMEKLEKELHERFQGDKKQESPKPAEKNPKPAPEAKTTL